MAKTHRVRQQATCHPDRPQHAKGLCRKCYFDKYMREYRAAGRHLPYVNGHREYHRHYMRKRRYGLTQEQHAEMLAEQGGGCAICGRTDKRLVVDHGHRDMAV